jgi:hypothetical protein
MALDARHRSSLYQKFVPLLGDDDANALMSEFPALEADELVTKQFLRAELAELRTDLRSEMHTEITGLRDEMHTEITGLRDEMHDLGTGLRREIAELRVEMERKFNHQTVWLGGIAIAGFSLLGIFR